MSFYFFFFAGGLIFDVVLKTKQEVLFVHLKAEVFVVVIAERFQKYEEVKHQYVMQCSCAGRMSHEKEVD